MSEEHDKFANDCIQIVCYLNGIVRSQDEDGRTETGRKFLAEEVRKELIRVKPHLDESRRIVDEYMAAKTPK